ncbi:hypothetical protein AGMMS50233_04470 [Endomicrobiia bacterium]|nr:hypothetical protein AGMMS50233_04470 [Endomicrobiia bacterium]
MNKKTVVALTVSTFLLTAMLQQVALAADNVSDQSGVKVSVDGMCLIQKKQSSQNGAKMIFPNDIGTTLVKTEHTDRTYLI